ncbi:hypothetical protein ACW0US_17805 [Xanthomonas euvesicatoria]
MSKVTQLRSPERERSDLVVEDVGMPPPPPPLDEDVLDSSWNEPAPQKKTGLISGLLSNEGAELGALDESEEQVALELIQGGDPGEPSASLGQGDAAAPKGSGDAAQSENAPESSIHPQVQQWEASLRGFDPAELTGEDEARRLLAERAWQKLVARAVILDRVFEGVREVGQRELPPKLFARMDSELMAASAAPEETSQLSFDSAAADRDQAQQHPGWHGGGGEGGSVLDSLIRSPLTLMAAGGSLAMKGLKAAHSAVGSAVSKQRSNAFDVLGKQVKSVARDIETDAAWLRAHGMEQVASELKASGLAPSDAISQMGRGGKLQHLGFQVQGMMTDPDFRAHMESMKDNLQKFSVMGNRYASAGAAIDRDPAELMEPVLDGLESATSDMPLPGGDGVFESMSEKLKEIVEQIREVIENLMRKLVPGR